MWPGNRHRIFQGHHATAASSFAARPPQAVKLLHHLARQLKLAATVFFHQCPTFSLFQLLGHTERQIQARRYRPEQRLKVFRQSPIGITTGQLAGWLFVVSLKPPPKEVVIEPVRL